MGKNKSPSLVHVHSICTERREFQHVSSGVYIYIYDYLTCHPDEKCVLNKQHHERVHMAAHKGAGATNGSTLTANKLSHAGLQCRNKSVIQLVTGF